MHACDHAILATTCTSQIAAYGKSSLAAAACKTVILFDASKGCYSCRWSKIRFFLPCVQCTYYLQPACIFPVQDSEFSQMGGIWLPNAEGVGTYSIVRTYEETRPCLFCTRCRSASPIIDVHRSARSQAPTIMCTVHASHVVGRGISSETCQLPDLGLCQCA